MRANFIIVDNMEGYTPRYALRYFFYVPTHIDTTEWSHVRRLELCTAVFGEVVPYENYSGIARLSHQELLSSLNFNRENARVYFGPVADCAEHITALVSLWEDLPSIPEGIRGVN